MKPKYRIRVYDLMHDLYVLEEHFFLFFWIVRGAGKKAEVEAKCKELNNTFEKG